MSEYSTASDTACLCGLAVSGACPAHPQGDPALSGGRDTPSWPPHIPGQVYVADTEGVVWLLVPEYDGGMATTATATGQWSVGINALTSQRGPLARVFPPDLGGVGVSGRAGCVVPMRHPGDAAMCADSCWQERIGKGHCPAAPPTTKPPNLNTSEGDD